MLNINQNKNVSKNLTNEIEELKNMIIEKQKEMKQENTYNIFNNFEMEEMVGKGKIILISGIGGAGKSITSTVLANILSMQNQKILLIEFDKDNSIYTILGKTKKELKNENIMSYKKNLDIVNLIELNKIEYIESIKNFFDSEKKKYDFLIVDFSEDLNTKISKYLLEICEKVIFLIEPNLLEIKKSKSLLEIYLNDYFIEANKIKIVLNKVDKYQISEKLLKEIFSKIEIIGKIQYEEVYTFIINKNFNKELDKDNYREIFKHL